MQTRGNRPVRSQMQNRAALKAFHGRDAFTFRDKQRKAQAERKEHVVANQKSLQAMMDRDAVQLRNAVAAIEQHQRKSQLVECDLVRDFVPMLACLRDLHAAPGPVLLVSCSDGDIRDDMDFLFMPNMNIVPIDFRSSVVAGALAPRVSPLLLMELIENSLAFDDLFQMSRQANLVSRHVMYEYFLDKDLLELEASESQDSRFARVAIDETESYLLVDPDPEATRRYYEGKQPIKRLLHGFYDLPRKTWHETEEYNERQSDGSVIRRRHVVLR